jgi:tellurite resistance protein
MGLLRDLTARTNHGDPREAGPLRDILSVMGTIDGKLDDSERAAIAGMFRSLPQLRSAPESPTPPKVNRAQLLEELKQIPEARLRRQCFVIAVEVALSSGGANESEDQYVERLRSALDIDEAFARKTIEVLAYKYACNNP